MFAFVRPIWLLAMAIAEGPRDVRLIHSNS
jgi:hypothetical protein